MKEVKYKELSTEAILAFGFKYMAHPKMKNILSHIERHPETTMTDMVIILRIQDQSVCSQFLKKLRHTNLIVNEYVGKHRYYRVTEQYLKMKQFSEEMKSVKIHPNNKKHVDTVPTSR